MNNIRISVIVPVYNGEKYIKSCLESLVNQTLKDIEIICIDDGSTDNSFKILTEYENKYSNINVFRQENAGVSEARNQGISKSRGEYIAFVDIDDYIELNMYEEMYKITKINDVEVVMCDFLHEQIDGNKKGGNYNLPSNELLNKDYIIKTICPNLMFDGVYNPIWNKIYSRKLIERVKFIMPRGIQYGEDLIFQLEIFDKIENIVFINKPLYHYIDRNGSLTDLKNYRTLDSFLPMYKLRKNYAYKWGIDIEIVNSYFIYYMLMDIIHTIKSKNIKEKFDTLKLYFKEEEICEILICGELHKDILTYKLKLMLGIIKILCIIINRKERKSNE